MPVLQIVLPFVFIEAGGDHGELQTLAPLVIASCMLLTSPAHVALIMEQLPSSGTSVLRSDRPRSPEPSEKKKAACADVRR